MLKRSLLLVVWMAGTLSLSACAGMYGGMDAGIHTAR
jgi:sulfite exporter TauE/SafE